MFRGGVWRVNKHRGVLWAYVIAAAAMSLVHVWHMFPPTLPNLFAGIPLLVYLATVAYAWRWAERTGVTDAGLSRAAGGALGGQLLLLVTVGLFIFSQSQLGVAIDGPELTLTSFGLIGSSFGILIGVKHVDWRNSARREEEARALLERQHEVITVLNRVLRHNVRNESNVILGYTELLRDERDDPRLRAIERATRRLLSKGELARSIERLGPVSSSTRLVSIGHAVTAEADALRESYPELDLSVEVRTHVPVRAHPLVTEALTQILENAVEHNDSSRPTVEVTVTTTERAEREYVEIAVADDGPGIPGIERRVLGEGLETPLQHSQGLGLWFTSWVVTASGGHVEITDREQDGTVVHLLLPVADARFEPTTEQEKATLDVIVESVAVPVTDELSVVVRSENSRGNTERAEDQRRTTQS